MKPNTSATTRALHPARVGFFWLLAFLLWTGLIAVLSWQDNRAAFQLIYKLAEAEARGSYNKDLAYRRWAAKQGGIYVQESEFTPPNPHLAHVAGRDLATTTGQNLTLVNPAYMTRQVYEMSVDHYRSKGHITSLNPLRPENAPDEWERKALESFELGSAEISGKVDMDGEHYLRMMFAMTTEEFCLKCHAHQGYKVGDIRGGISVSIPLSSCFDAYYSSRTTIMTNNFILWLIGSLLLLGSFIATRRFLWREHGIRCQLEASEQKYRRLFNDATIGYCLADTENGEILECNEALAEMVEYRVDELIGQSQCLLLADSGSSGGMAEKSAFPRRELSGKILPARLATRGGRAFDVEIKPQYFERDGQTLFFGIFQDVSERVEADRVLRESEAKYRALLDNQKDAIFLHRAEVDTCSAFVEVNAAASERYGFSRDELLNQSFEDLVAPELLSERKGRSFFNGVLGAGGRTFESVLVTREGEAVEVEISTSVISLKQEEYFLSIVRDISERKIAEKKEQELESQLRQKYKMEAVGTMAGGIAHDFNNILAIIITNLELMKRKAGKNNPLLPRIDQARAASARASELVRQILTYSRQGEQSLKPIRIAEEVEDTLNLLRATIPASIEILKEIDEDARAVIVDADPIQIEEVLFNLCNNAAFAMGEKGLLSVSLKIVSPAVGELPMQLHELRGQCLKLSVADTGSGIPEAEIEKIFDPFFTTKPKGEGTGMGLAISHGIISRHKGFMKVESSPGQGSTFSVYLPLSNNPASTLGEENWEEVGGGSEHVLIVDDEEPLALSIRDYFRDYGYEVTCESDSVAAFDLVRSDSARFDLVITDQTMPGKTGMELTQDILAMRADLPIILCTGYSETVTEEKALACGARAFILKPVSLPGLLRSARAVLDEGKSG